ncbi:hypothetical protein BJ980_001564 [Nocardioides daedukensis]|uniref:Lipoprotein n=1 Tax=Nocardioides daedukensis TaxID=634462 RepID=A0A7Y9RXT0_9ACTN|nr:hypothetical protein [Nocardioides daedukensis]NYG58641.1 hypothetical protein [Nocardioides daedukensis]
MIKRFTVSALILLLGLVMVACGESGSNEEDEMDDLRAARDTTTAAVKGVTATVLAELGGTAKPATANYGTCGTSPTEGLIYHEFVDWSDEADTAALDQARAAVEAEGWTLDPPSNTTVEVRNLRRDDLRLTLKLQRGVLTWSVTGICVRVSSEVANDLVGPYDPT